MILECVDILVPAGKEAKFERAIELALSSALSKSPGYLGHKVQKGIESPQRYLLWVYWNTLEDHTQGFRGSPLFAQWRAIVGPFFAQPPQVEHFSLVLES